MPRFLSQSKRSRSSTESSRSPSAHKKRSPDRSRSRERPGRRRRSSSLKARSPLKKRSSSRQRSPLRRRSSPRQRSPVRRRSLPRHRPPIRRRSSPRQRSPLRRRSSSRQRRSPEKRRSLSNQRSTRDANEKGDGSVQKTVEKSQGEKNDDTKEREKKVSDAKPGALKRDVKGRDQMDLRAKLTRRDETDTGRKEECTKQPNDNASSRFDKHTAGGPRSLELKRDISRPGEGRAPPDRSRLDERRSRVVHEAESTSSHRDGRRSSLDDADYKQTKCSLHERFSGIEGANTTAPLVPERITVGIERDIEGNEPAVLRLQLHPDDVVVVRRRGEGSKPLYMRHEFTASAADPPPEKRIVRMVHTNSPHNFEVQRDKFESGEPTRSRMLSDRWAAGHVLGHERRGRDVDTGDGRPGSPRIRSRERHESARERDDPLAGSSHFERPPADLRNSLVAKRRDTQPDSREDRYHDSQNIRLRVDRRSDLDIQRRVVETRHDGGFDRRGRLADRGGSTQDRGNRRDHQGSSREQDVRMVLPDFSKREDKYNVPEWENRPEMIPRGSSYFEHDNRGDVGYYRGRGRGGGYRGRGWFNRGGHNRGGFNRAGNNKQADSFDSWKHDKFEEFANEEEDNKPTSTT